MIQRFNRLIEFYNGSINSNLCGHCVSAMLTMPWHRHSLALHSQTTFVALIFNYTTCNAMQCNAMHWSDSARLYRRTGQLCVCMKNLHSIWLDLSQKDISKWKSVSLCMNNKFMPFFLLRISLIHSSSLPLRSSFLLFSFFSSVEACFYCMNTHFTVFWIKRIVCIEICSLTLCFIVNTHSLIHTKTHLKKNIFFYSRQSQSHMNRIEKSHE